MEKVRLMDDDMGAVMLRCAQMIGGSRCTRVPDETVAYIVGRAEEAERAKASGPSTAMTREEVDGADRESPSTPPLPENAQGVQSAPVGASAGIADPAVPPKASGPSPANEWLQRYLDGYTAARDVREAAELAGYRWRDVERAKWELKIKSVKVGGRWYWEPAG